MSDEVVADVCAELFGNKEFIQSVAEKKPNIFKKILNNIKELARKIKGTGADEYINFVEKLKTMWEGAYYSNQSNINDKTFYNKKLFQDILLRNKNLNAQSKIPIIYITENVDSTIPNSTRLQESFKNNVKNGEYKNKATDYIASITSETKGKIINPNANKTNFKSNNYILRLISANNLPKLFENAVYIDTLPAMKNKNKNPSELGYHHFVAPININGTDYRVLISGKVDLCQVFRHIFWKDIISVFKFIPISF